ncbi:MAG: response regulator [bacterium]|nr:response regulator [bacterium]
MAISRSWLKAPQTDDPQQQFRATVIHQLSITFMVTIVPLILLIPIVDDGYRSSLPVYLTAIAGTALTFVVLHGGYIRTAGAMFAIFGWIITLWSAVATGSLGSPQLSMAVFVLMLAGFLWSGTAAIGMAIVICMSLLGFELVRDAGLLPEPSIEVNRFATWAVLSSVLALSAVMLQIFVRAMRAARDDAAEKTLRLEEEMDRRVETEISLHRAQKLEALGRLTGGIAHDFNNILTVLVAESEMLEESTTPGQPLSEEECVQISEIRASADRASDLTSQLLAFSRNQAGVPELVAPDTRIARLEPMLKRLIREDVLLEVSPDAKGARIRIDPSQLDQVVMNLVLNSSDAMPRGGALSVSTERAFVDDDMMRIEPTAQPGEHVVIRVRDTGEGIEVRDLERIFDPFFTTKGVGRGTGLGLASAHGIVTQAGGHIRVKSSTDSGTTFDVYLPEVEVVGVTELPSGETKRPVKHVTTGTILLCEDDDAVRRSTCRTLVAAGYDVFDVGCAEDALAWLSDKGFSVDLLVSDVILPGMNGVELARLAVNRNPSLRVVLVSGYTANVLKESGVPPEVELLEKPFKPESLLERIAAQLSV